MSVGDGLRSAPYVGVVGAGVADAALSATADAVGRELGRSGAVLVCGGGGGVMEAACRGARAVGGTTVGILPVEDRSWANPFVDIAIPTGIGELRNGLIVRSADVVLAIGGAFGTLSEIALALRIGRPVVGLGTWSARWPDGGEVTEIVRASDPADAVTRALALVEIG